MKKLFITLLALVVMSPVTFGAVNKDIYGIEKEYLYESSLSISIPNLNLNSIPDNHPLFTEQIEILKNHYVNDAVIKSMSYSDFNNWERGMLMDSKTINDASGSLEVLLNWRRSYEN